jgi:hypothetical protein
MIIPDHVVVKGLNHPKVSCRAAKSVIEQYGMWHWQLVTGAADESMKGSARCHSAASRCPSFTRRIIHDRHRAVAIVNFSPNSVVLFIAKSEVNIPRIDITGKPDVLFGALENKTAARTGKVLTAGIDWLPSADSNHGPDG